MDEAVTAYENGDKCAAQTYAGHARAYAELLKAHIVKEDFILYPMADEAFSDDDQQQLAAAFDEVEAGHGDHHEKFLAVAAELGEYYGVPRPTEPNHEGLAGVCPAHASLPCNE
jgi:hemerythrin-like domain-containing protein